MCSIYTARLASRRHNRYFVHLCDKHPLGRTARQRAAPIVQGIAACAGSVLPTTMISRCFFAAVMHLTAQLPWRFAGREGATFEGHDHPVASLALLKGGRLASGSRDGTIKIWEFATTCLATLEGHQNSVNSQAVLEGGRLASGSSDEPIKIWDLATGAHAPTRARSR